MSNGRATAHLYRPKLATVLSEGYSVATFQRDLTAALTVAVVALPLSMAIAVASGVSPERGLYTAIIGGFLVSALGGSRYQIGGPAGAFIVLVSATVTAQGPLFGGISVTGTIARTATNIRAGARSPFAGMMHAAFLLLFMILAAPLASYIPLAALAGVLLVVCWNMAEKEEFALLLRQWSTAGVLLVTFLLTVFIDLTYGIVAGCIFAAAITVSNKAWPAPGSVDSP